MAWDTGLQQGFIRELRTIFDDLDKKVITVSYVEDCVIHCRSDPNCKYVIVHIDLMTKDHPREAGSRNCWLIYTEY